MVLFPAQDVLLHCFAGPLLDGRLMAQHKQPVGASLARAFNWPRNALRYLAQALGQPRLENSLLTVGQTQISLEVREPGRWRAI